MDRDLPNCNASKANGAVTCASLSGVCGDTCVRVRSPNRLVADICGLVCVCETRLRRRDTARECR